MSDTSVSFRIAATETGSAQVQGLARAAEQAAAAEAQLAAQMRAASAAAQGMVKGTNGAASAAGNLRFQLFDVVQQLSAGQNPMMIANQQGFQIAQAFSSAGQAGATMGQTIKAALGPLAAMGPAAAIVGAAVLALGGAYVVLSRDLDAAIEKMNASAEAATRAAEAHDKWKTGTQSLDEELGLASGELDKYDIMARRMTEAVDGAAAGMLGFHTQQVAAARAAVQAARANESGITSALDQERAALAAAAAFAESVQARKDEIPTVIAHKMATDAATGSDREAAKAARDAAKAQREAAAARLRAMSAEEQYLRVKSQVTQMEIDFVAAQLDADRFAPPQVSEWEALANQIDALVPQKTLTDMEKLAELSARVTEALAGGKLTTEQAAALTAQLSTASSAVAAESAPSMAGTAGKVGQALSSPLAAAASLHPIAQAVLAGLQSAANMQDGKSVFTEAADLIAAALTNLGPFVESAFKAAADILANAPRLLVEALPEILQAIAAGIPMLAESVAEMATGLIEALAEALPQMIPELVIILGQIFIGAVPMIAVALASAILDPAFYEAIAEAFARGIEAAFDRIGQVGDDLGQTLGTGTTAGGGFQLFGLPIVPAPSGGSGGGSVVIQPGDLWGDFTRSIELEASKLGRT